MKCTRREVKMFRKSINFNLLVICFHKIYEMLLIIRSIEGTYISDIIDIILQTQILITESMSCTCKNDRACCSIPLIYSCKYNMFKTNTS
jgi:hypothetical protein